LSQGSIGSQMESPSVSGAGVPTQAQLSITSPTVQGSRSSQGVPSVVLSQGSMQSAVPSPSVSVSATPQPQTPGAILFGSLGQPSVQSEVPSPSVSTTGVPAQTQLSITSPIVQGSPSSQA